MSEICEAIRPTSILELGCGVGSFLSQNPQYRGKVNAVQKLFNAQDLGILESLGYKILDREILSYFKEGFDETYDLVICTDVIEHFLRSDAFSIIDFSLYRAKWMVLVWPSSHPQDGVPSSLDRHRSSFSIEAIVRDFDLVYYLQTGFAELHVIHRYHLAVLRGHMNLENFPRAIRSYP